MQRHSVSPKGVAQELQIHWQRSKNYRINYSQQKRLKISIDFQIT